MDRSDGEGDECEIGFALVGHAGTVHTGAIDDLSALADLAEREGLWLHVDAGYLGQTLSKFFRWKPVVRTFNLPRPVGLMAEGHVPRR